MLQEAPAKHFCSEFMKEMRYDLAADFDKWEMQRKPKRNKGEYKYELRLRPETQTLKGYGSEVVQSIRRHLREKRPGNGFFDKANQLPQFMRLMDHVNSEPAGDPTAAGRKKKKKRKREADAAGAGAAGAASPTRPEKEEASAEDEFRSIFSPWPGGNRPPVFSPHSTEFPPLQQEVGGFRFRNLGGEERDDDDDAPPPCTPKASIFSFMQREEEELVDQEMEDVKVEEGGGSMMMLADVAAGVYGAVA
jgi:hypothetical protein